MIIFQSYNVSWWVTSVTQWKYLYYEVLSIMISRNAFKQSKQSLIQGNWLNNVILERMIYIM